jgi:replicative DNA helicase
MFVYREEYYHERLKPAEDDPAFTDWLAKMERVHNKAEAIIGKQRHGPIGTVELQFDGRFTRFSDLAREDRRDLRDFS